MESPLRSFVAVLFGLMSIFVVRMLANLFAVHYFGSAPLLAGRVFAFNVAAICLAAFLGGMFTAMLAGNRRVRHGCVLAMVLLVLSVMTAARVPVQGAPVAQILLLLGPPIAAVAGSALAQVLARRISARR